MAAVPAASALSDAEVVRQVRAGNRPLFEILMRRHNQRVYRAARAVMKDEHEVEDVMQQAYVNAYCHLDQFDSRSRFSTWLTRIAVHEALARARSRDRYADVDPDDLGTPDSSITNPEHQVLSIELGELLESAIDRLPDGVREVFVLRKVEGMSTEETAEALEIGDGMVRTRLSRACAALRRDLCDHIGIAEASAFRFLRPRCDRIVRAVLTQVMSRDAASHGSV
jgi:RNA polymerase sigma-70 factor (ECF subfamily)